MEAFLYKYTTLSVHFCTMEHLIFIFIILAVLAKTEETNYDDKFAEIRSEAEIYCKILPDAAMEDDAKLKIPEIIKKYGYPSEVHTVITNDGYIDELHRIPYGKSGPIENRPAVYLQHGLHASSADWIITGPGKGFGYILADAGYDVWMPNVRGTRYSRNHTYLHPDKDAAKFWDFSWHDIAIDDVAVMIDYVINTVKQEKIFYIGHSQGTTLFYVLCSERPEYNNKILAMFSLGPIGFMGRMFSPIMRFAALIEPFARPVSKWFRFYEFLPHSNLTGLVGKRLCGDNSVLQPLCTSILFMIGGFNKKQLNATLLPVIMGHIPAGSSTKQMLHFAQEVNTGKWVSSGQFRMFSYGRTSNKKIYKNETPPSYKLENIKAPLYFYYSKNDWLSNSLDVKKLYLSCGSRCKCIHKISDKKFNHFDFVYAMNAPEVLYQKILKQMDAVSKCNNNKECKCSQCVN